MKKIIMLGIAFLFLFILGIQFVNAINRYYSPFITGSYPGGTTLGRLSGSVTQGGVVLFPVQLLYENLILGTPDSTIPDINFTKCTFNGNGANNYKYANVFGDGYVLLTDSTYISVFDSQCSLLDYHQINGTLESNPVIIAGEVYPFVAWLSSPSGTISQLNYIKFNTQTNSFFPDSYKVTAIQNEISNYCFGLYCDYTFNSCASFCTAYVAGSTSKYYWRLFDFISDEFDLRESINLGNYGWVYHIGHFYDPSTVSTLTIADNQAGMITGMDLDGNGRVDVSAIVPTSSSGDWSVFTVTPSNGVQSKAARVFYNSGVAAGGDIWLYSALNAFQSANIGEIQSEGEFFLSVQTGYVGQTFTSTIKRYNDLGIVKSLSKTYSLPYSNRHTNWAVADINKDIKNDYCIAYNDSIKNRIICYSGDGNLRLANCSFDWNGANNIEGLSLMSYDTNPDLEAIMPSGIFKLRNDGLACSKLYSFDSVTASNRGIMVPVELKGQISPSLIYLGDNAAYLFSSGAIDMPIVVGGELTCSAPHIILCDNFNYGEPIYTKGWLVQEPMGDLNLTLAPIESRLNVTQNRRIIFDHALPSVKADYTISQEVTILKSQAHPVVSISLDFEIPDNHTLMYIRMADGLDLPSVFLRIDSSQLQVYNVSSSSPFTKICDNCITRNVSHSLKITAFYGQDVYTESHHTPDFNTSVKKSFYEVYMDNVQYGSKIPFADNASYSSIDFYIKLYQNTNLQARAIFDNLLIYRGDSSIVDTSYKYFEQIYIPTDNASIIVHPFSEVPAGKHDFAKDLKEGVEDWGFISATSKLFFALVIIIVLIIMVAYYLGKAGVSGNAVGILAMIIGILSMFFFTYIGFIPVWIIFFLFLMGAGIVALMLIKVGSNG